MIRCPDPDCGWQAIAPSDDAARDQYAAHLVDAHTESVDAEVPEGMVQVRVGDGEWRTMTAEQATTFHDATESDD